MSCYFLNNNFQEAIDYAKIVLEDKNITNINRVDAEYVNGVGCYKLEKFTEASTSFNWLVKNTNTSITAESRYYLADIYVKSNNQILAEKEINAVLKMKPRHDFWIGKALLLKTTIDISNNDYVQAEQSLRSVLDFYPKDLNDGILIEANEMWDELMQLKNPIKIIEEEGDKKIEIN
jgi:tetratricopeptide (TPR) repeat protein